jgi:hypothetical protein
MNILFARWGDKMTSQGMTQGEIVRLDLPDVLSAALVPGSKRPLHGNRPDMHSSDALLVSRSVPVVAVADGPERNPVASSSFLAKFDSALAASGIRTGQRPVAELFGAVVDVVTTLMRTIDYHDSTTFSALIPLSDGTTPVAIVLHTGDSLIFRVRPAAGEVTQISRTSHVLVGRAPALFQTEIIELDPADLVVLASDGITDLARTHGLGPGALLSAGGPAASPAAVVGGILESVARASVRLDDITIVCAAVRAFSVRVDEQDGRPVILS